MRYIRYVFLAIIGIALLVVALANRNDATVTALPSELADFAGINYSITLPMFVIIFVSIVVGILLGFVWEWLREHKHRAEASAQRRAREQLEREMTELKGPPKKGGEDVLALLD